MPYPVVIIVCNDFGGGIFKSLPIGEFSEIMNPYLHTPHRRAFNKLASFYDDLEFARIEKASDLETVISEAFVFEKHMIVECFI